MPPLHLNGATIEFKGRSGKVVGSTKRSDTYVSGGGGGGTNGNSAPVSISSTVVVRHEFFLKDESGQEKSYQMSGLDIPLRDGQTVTMIHAIIDDKRWNYVRLVNHSARSFSQVRLPKDLILDLKLVRSNGMNTAIILGAWVAGFFLPGPWWLYFVAGIGYGVKEQLHRNRTGAALNEHANMLAQEALTWKLVDDRLEIPKSSSAS